MIVESAPWWPSAVLALVLLSDALMSIKPLEFIEGCLQGVGLPRQWWWLTVYTKLIAVTGLVCGFWLVGVGVAAQVGVIAYFVAAVVAHVRAKFYGRLFWMNCLGMLALSCACLVITLVV